MLTATLRQIEKTKAGKGQEFLPRDDFDPIINSMISTNPSLDFGKDKNGFDALCNFNNYDQYMRDVIRLKIKQNPSLQETAKQLARDGIIPIEYSRHDKTWASGKDGDGQNKLGIMILEEGNRLLELAGEKPKISNPKQAYDNMKKTGGGTAALTHDALDKLSSQMTKKTKPAIW